MEKTTAFITTSQDYAILHVHQAVVLYSKCESHTLI